MNRLLLFLLTLFFAASTFAETKPLPQTQAELQKFLLNTTWLSDGKADHPYTFRKSGIFEGKKSKPTFKVTGRRTVTISWGSDTKIPCLITEDCATMIELSGARHTYIRK